MSVDLIRPNSFQGSDYILEGILGRKVCLGDVVEDAVQHLKGQVVDEQPPLEGILILHETGIQIQGVVVAFEILLDLLSCLVQGVDLGLIKIRTVRLENEGADPVALLHSASDVDALH